MIPATPMQHVKTDYNPEVRNDINELLYMNECFHKMLEMGIAVRGGDYMVMDLWIAYTETCFVLLKPMINDEIISGIKNNFEEVYRNRDIMRARNKATGTQSYPNLVIEKLKKIQEILIQIKHNLNLGIRFDRKLTPNERLKRVMEIG